MIFTQRAGGVSRCRVIFRFDNIVSEAEKAGSYRKRLRLKSLSLSADCWANFTDPEKARALLLEQRDGDEALAIKQQTDPVIEFCQFLNFWRKRAA